MVVPNFMAGANSTSSHPASRFRKVPAPLLGTLEWRHGAETRTAGRGPGRDGLGRHRRRDRVFGFLARLCRGDHLRGIRRVLLWTAGRCGGRRSPLRGFGGAYRWRRGRPGVRTRGHARVCGGGPEYGYRGDRGDSFGYVGAEYLRRPGLAVLFAEPRGRRFYTGGTFDPGLNGGRSLGYAEEKRE